MKIYYPKSRNFKKYSPISRNYYPKSRNSFPQISQYLPPNLVITPLFLVIRSFASFNTRPSLELKTYKSFKILKILKYNINYEVWGNIYYFIMS